MYFGDDLVEVGAHARHGSKDALAVTGSGLDVDTEVASRDAGSNGHCLGRITPDLRQEIAIEVVEGFADFQAETVLVG